MAINADFCNQVEGEQQEQQHFEGAPGKEQSLESSGGNEGGEASSSQQGNGEAEQDELSTSGEEPSEGQYAAQHDAKGFTEAAIEPISERDFHREGMADMLSDPLLPAQPAAARETQVKQPIAQRKRKRPALDTDEDAATVQMAVQQLGGPSVQSPPAASLDAAASLLQGSRKAAPVSTSGRSQIRQPTGTGGRALESKSRTQHTPQTPVCRAAGEASADQDRVSAQPSRERPKGNKGTREGVNPDITAANAEILRSFGPARTFGKGRPQSAADSSAGSPQVPKLASGSGRPQKQPSGPGRPPKQATASVGGTQLRNEQVSGAAPAMLVPSAVGRAQSEIRAAAPASRERSDARGRFAEPEEGAAQELPPNEAPDQAGGHHVSQRKEATEQADLPIDRATAGIGIQVRPDIFPM